MTYGKPGFKTNAYKTYTQYGRLLLNQMLTGMTFQDNTLVPQIATRLVLSNGTRAN